METTNKWEERFDKRFKDTLNRIKTKIKKAKTAVQKATGSYKYDNCYDECIEIINKEL